MKSAIRFLWKQKTLFLFIILIAAFITLTIFGYVFDLRWTGFPAYVSSSIPSTKQYQPAKTLWDWLQLLVIPFGLAIIAYLFNRAERRNDRDNTLDNQQETILQAYIDRVSELLLQTNISEENADRKGLTILRARTLEALKKLDPDRKTSLFGFLWEAGLIGKFSLDYADLSGADLSGASLRQIKMKRANLCGANLHGATLDNAELLYANLKGANLSRTMLYDADLRGANLRNADFTDAYLTRANIQEAAYSEKQLKKAAKLEGLIR